VEQALEFKDAFDALHQLVRRRVVRPEERCELCSKGVGPTHQHLIDPVTRKLVCACDHCSLLFSAQHSTKYKRVPRDIRFLPDFRLSAGVWDGLMVPINMAFFFRSSVAGKMIALYPSPAGATESLLALETWDEIVEENPVLQSMEADVEALLVNRLGAMRGFETDQHYILPIDECFKLVGLIRTHWRGLSGGTEVWQETHQFFDSLRHRSGFAREVSRA
jgi:hypothetical protein